MTSALPAPEEELLFAELRERLLLQFPPDQRDVVQLSIQGHTVKEISTALGGCAERTIYRIREHLQAWLRREASKP